MKLFIFGYLLGIFTVVAYLTRARWFPWARSKEQRIVDALVEKDTADDSKTQP